VDSIAHARVFRLSLIDLGARETTMRRPMNAQRSGQQWFQCFSPDGLITRQNAVDLIRKHAARARIFEDLEGHPTLMIATQGSRRLVLLTDLTDAQIRHELPTAWLREHQQADMFRDAASSVANDEHYRAERRTKTRRTLKDVFVAMFGWR
jgi:hypothetical protein